jgi:hypothetical protein
MKHLTECQLNSVHQDAPELEERILLHLAKCDSCERGTEPAIDRYRAYRREATRLVPRPPHPWRDIWMEMDRADAILSRATRSESARRPRPVWSGLAAGAVLGGVLLLWPRPDARLRAETLLPQIEASVSRSPSRARQGLRVRTPAATFLRPALLGVSDRSSPNWRERFRAARYDWNDPLSPRAFSEWRNSLKRKSDRVLIRPASSSTPKELTIQTTAQESLLQEASLTVDAASLLPIRAKFVFAPEDWIEISVIPNFLPEAEMAASHAPAVPKSADASEASGVIPQPPANDSHASTELAVWLIADRLSDPTGEPIRMDIRDGNRISVTPYSLNAGQLQQLSVSLQGIPGVDLHIPNSSQSAPEAPPERDPAINLSETIFSRAHLLADLAEHFPEAVEMKLSPSARIELWQLRSHHASRLEQEIEALEVRLKNPGPANNRMNEAPTATSLIQKLVLEAGKVNRSVIITSAARTGDPEAGPAWQKLADEIARLKELADEYASSVAQGLEKLR